MLYSIKQEGGYELPVGKYKEGS